MLKIWVLFTCSWTTPSFTDCKEYCDNKDLILIFNAASASEFNPIERFWAISKRHLYKELLVENKKKTSKEQVELFIAESLL